MTGMGAHMDLHALILKHTTTHKQTTGRRKQVFSHAGGRKGMERIGGERRREEARRRRQDSGGEKTWSKERRKQRWKWWREGWRASSGVRKRGRRKERGNEEQAQGARWLHNTCMWRRVFSDAACGVPWSQGGQRQKVKLNNVHKKWQLPEKSSPSFTEACRIHSN